MFFKKKKKYVVLGKVQTTVFSLRDIQDNYIKDSMLLPKPYIYEDKRVEYKPIESFKSNINFIENMEIYIKSCNTIGKIYKIVNSSDGDIYLYTTYVLENNILGTKKETFEDLLAVALRKYKEQEREIKLANIEHDKLLKKQKEETRKKLLEKYKNNEIFGLLHLKVPLNGNGDPVLPLNTCAELKMYLDEILPEGVFSSVLPFEMSYFNFKELFK